MKEKEMKMIGNMINETNDHLHDKAFHEKTRRQVRDLCEQFPLGMELINKH